MGMEFDPLISPINLVIDYYLVLLYYICCIQLASMYLEFLHLYSWITLASNFPFPYCLCQSGLDNWIWEYYQTDDIIWAYCLFLCFLVDFVVLELPCLLNIWYIFPVKSSSLMFSLWRDFKYQWMKLFWIDLFLEFVWYFIFF